MCEFFDLECQATETAQAVADSLLGRFAEMVADAQTSLITTSVTWWLRLPPADVESTTAVTTLQSWMLPFAAIVATGGMLWQCLLLVVNRKGEPLIQIVKGLFATAIWGAVSVTGTQLLLQGCEAYTEWVLTRGMDCAPGIGQDAACKTDALSTRMQLLLAPTLPGVGPVLVIVVGMVVLLASCAQAVLLLFRNGAILVLAGVLQLAAAGTFTGATGNWLRKILGWLLALTFYEPFAATTYALAFMLIGDRANDDLATWFTGVGMLGLSLVALPAMLRFFNWTVGAVQSTGGSAGMLAAAGAAGLHAAASRRGVAVMSAADYARDMDRRYQSAPPPAPPVDAVRPTPPTFTGPPAAPAASSSAGTTTAAAASTTSASAAGGPTGPVVAGTVVAARAAAAGARAAAEHGSGATDGTGRS